MFMADMSDMLKSFSSMMEKNEIPDNVKEMFNSFVNNSNNQNNNGSSNNQNFSRDKNISGNKENFNTDTSASDMPDIDINTILKMQKIMSAMNNSSNNSGANLLRSLKPYLKPSRQAKVDEYIQIFNIEKVIGLMKQTGGDIENDT